MGVFVQQGKSLVTNRYNIEYSIFSEIIKNFLPVDETTQDLAIRETFRDINQTVRELD